MFLGCLVVFLFCPEEISAAVVSVAFRHIVARKNYTSFSVLMVSGSVLNSLLVIVSIVDGSAPQLKPFLISGCFVSQGSPVGFVLSTNICLMNTLYILFM